MFKEFIKAKNTKELQRLTNIYLKIETLNKRYKYLDDIDLSNLKTHFGILSSLISNPYTGMLPIRQNNCLITRYGQYKRFISHIIQLLDARNLLIDKELCSEINWLFEYTDQVKLLEDKDLCKI